MKNNFNNYKRLLAWSIVLSAFSLYSCADWTLPPELVGDWKSGEMQITVRTKAEKEWIFISDSARIAITINSDHSVTGTIGTAAFENGVIKKNRGNPDVTGCAQIIECGSIGKIFNDDPLDAKEVELWLGPLEGNMIDTELRYTEDRAQFPMAGMLLIKVGLEY
jgi:hypothetical protein